MTSDPILKCFHGLRSAESQCLPYTSDFLLVCKSSTMKATENDQIPVLLLLKRWGKKINLLEDLCKGSGNRLNMVAVKTFAAEKLHTKVTVQIS